MKLLIVVLFTLLSVSAHAEQQPNLKKSSETYSDWLVECIESQEQKRCEMKQNLVNQNQQLIAVFSLIKRKADKSTLVQIALPHLLDLTTQVKVAIDDKNTKSLPFKFCNRTACFVIIDNDAKFISQLQKGNAGLVTSKVVNGEDLKLNFSLKGFSAALKALPAI